MRTIAWVSSIEAAHKAVDHAMYALLDCDDLTPKEIINIMVGCYGGIIAELPPMNWK